METVLYTNFTSFILNRYASLYKLSNMKEVTAMDILSLIARRRSVRSYSDQPVEREKLELLAEAVRLAPSATNTQPWHLIFVDDRDLKNKVAAAAYIHPVPLNRFAVGAPVCAVLVIEKQDALHVVGAFLQGRSYPLIDIGIASAQLCLLATELGLGTCMIGWFNERKIKKILNIPHGRKIGLLITIGYPANDLPPKEKDRKPLEEIRSYNAYGI